MAVTKYDKVGPNGPFFDWGQFASDSFGFDIYKDDIDLTKSELAAKTAHMLGRPVVDVKMSEFVPQDYRGIPDFEVQGFRPTGVVARQMTQLEIDIFEANGGFDDPEND